MPAFLEKKLKEEYAGEDPSIPFKIMNANGLMRGSKETAKGRALDRKHASDKKGGHKRAIHDMLKHS